MTRNELEKSLETLLAQRKKAYKLRVGSLFISAINQQIRTTQNQINALEEVAA